MIKNITDNLILNFAPTGMIPTKEMTKFVPVSINEIIDQVFSASELGITIVHLHARDSETGKPSYKSGIYAKIIEGIRKYNDRLVICVSLSGRDFNEFEKRTEVLNLDSNLKPDMGSLTLSSLNFSRQASVNSPQMVYDLADKMKQKRILPELEAFDLGMVNYMHYLIKKNIITAPYYINLLFGNIAGAQADLSHIGIMLNDLPEQTYWSLAGLGNTQLMMNSIAVAYGGGVRTGLEDNIFYDRMNKKLAPNLELVKRIHNLAELHERQIMKPEEFRQNLNLNPGNGSYGLKDL